MSPPKSVILKLIIPSIRFQTTTTTDTTTTASPEQQAPNSFIYDWSTGKYTVLPNIPPFNFLVTGAFARLNSGDYVSVVGGDYVSVVGRDYVSVVGRDYVSVVDG